MKSALIITGISVLLGVAAMLAPNNKIVLDAPNVVKINEVVILDASASTIPFAWYSETDYKVIDKKAIFCATKLGEYTFILVAADGTVVKHVISVKLVIIDKFDIKNWLPKNFDSEIIEKLARSFERVAVAGHTDISVLIKTTAASNRAILGSDIEKWKPFLEHFSAYLNENFTDKNIDEHIEMWFKLASELRKQNAAS